MDSHPNYRWSRQQENCAELISPTFALLYLISTKNACCECEDFEKICEDFEECEDFTKCVKILKFLQKIMAN